MRVWCVSDVTANSLPVPVELPVHLARHGIDIQRNPDTTWSRMSDRGRKRRFSVALAPGEGYQIDSAAT